MTFVKRIGFFLLTNILVITTLMITMTILQQVFGISMEGYAGILVISVVFGFGGSLISLMMSKWVAKKMMGIQIIDQNVNDARLRNVVVKTHQYARAAGIKKVPEVGVYQSPEVNAFATGPSRNNSLVAVSTGLLERMNDDEVDGVLGHEVAHISNGDMVTMTLIQGIINAVAIFLSIIIAKAIANQINKDNRGGSMLEFFIRIPIQIALSLLGSIVVMWFSRHREFRADIGGAKLAGREKMLGGLRKLQNTLDLVDDSQEAVASFKISGGRKTSIWKKLFAGTHPPLAERIRRLESASIL